MELKGRYRGIMQFGAVPEDIQPGDYWQVGDGQDPAAPLIVSSEPSNLTGEAWYVAAPMSYGFALGYLRRHTVRSNEDGTISVLPGDGSSNSILITGRNGEQWHGYIYNGVWKSV